MTKRRIVRQGDVVFFSTKNDTEQIRCEVILASPNGRSLMLQFEAVVAFPSGIYVGKMPVYLTDSDKWVELVGHHEIRIEHAH